jgi:hypothetical protein
MAIPVISSFTAGQNLALPQPFGLNTRNGSSNRVFITGQNMAAELKVDVTNNAGITWSGVMGAFSNSTWPATLTCANNQTGEGDTMEVDVTVTNTSTNEKSPTFPKQVTTGSN